MNYPYLIRRILFVIMMLSGISIYAQSPNLVWEDNFNGTSLDLSKWSYQTGDGCAEGICGWGNNELQTYQQANVTVSNGTLKITARKERVRNKNYTSGRIRSKGKGDFTYGRYEARIKLPAGAGLWPAFWMLSTDEPYGGWPKSGEIDIMEFIGSQPETVLGYIHYGPDWPNNQHQGNLFHLYDGRLFPDNFHVFAIEWEPGEIRWYVDDILYSVKTQNDVAPYNWPFNHDFHFLLNVAVGGSLGGAVDDSIFPATMEVDYVRVYDGPRPTISGKRRVAYKAQGEKYKVHNIPSNVNVTWSVPAGASIVSGQGSNEVTVNFNESGGHVTATFNIGSGNQSLPIDVTVEPNYVKAFTFVNFDEQGAATYASSTGTLSVVQNPAPNAVNGSALCGRYVRNSQEQYDVLVYNTSAISNANLYSSGESRFFIDVYTNAPVGTEILLQLETSNASPSNYPTGRHSRYVATITQNGSWHRLPFIFLDKPDGNASPNVSKIILLFNSNSHTGDTYHFDNLDSYSADQGGGSPNMPPVVSISSPSNGSSFTEGTSITITASASDPDGSVTQVEFFANGASIGVDSSAPYSVNWTIPAGTHTLTAVATDNEGASTTSSPVTVTGTSSGGGEATSIYVASVVTGTASAGQGRTRGTATVTILNNLGNPSSGALVTGIFSGTFHETVSGTTNSNGQVTLQTTESARGGVTVNFCVNNVSGSLPYDPAMSGAYACSSSGTASLSARTSEENNTNNSLIFEIYPNPAKTELKIMHDGFEETASIAVFNMSGKMLIRTRALNSSLDVSTLPSGIYLLKVFDNRNLAQKLFIKQ